MNDTENNTEKVRLENNATTPFSDSYHNRENIDIFYNLYEKEKYNNPICINTDKWSQGNDSKDNFINRINYLVTQTYSFTPGAWDNPTSFFEYYAILYFKFLLFNYYNSFFNNFGQPFYTGYSYKVNFWYKQINFQALNYNTSEFYSHIDWKNHCIQVKETLKFIKENKLKTNLIIECYEEDLIILSLIMEEYFNLLNKKQSSDAFEKYEELVSKIELKNMQFSDYPKRSLYNNTFLKEYISSFNKTFKEVEKINSELTKSKDFYLIVSGAAMTLTSLIIGNIAFADKSFLVEQMLVFNLSILVSILIFYNLFKSTYIKNKNFEYNISFVLIVIFIIILLLLLILGSLKQQFPTSFNFIFRFFVLCF